MEGMVMVVVMAELMGLVEGMSEEDGVYGRNGSGGGDGRWDWRRWG
jgi:hypothetical protein